MQTLTARLKVKHNRILELRNPSRASERFVRYECRYQGYDRWRGAIVPAYYMTDYRQDPQFNAAIKDSHFDTLGRLLARV